MNVIVMKAFHCFRVNPSSPGRDRSEFSLDVWSRIFHLICHTNDVLWKLDKYNEINSMKYLTLFY